MIGLTGNERGAVQRAPEHCGEVKGTASAEGAFDPDLAVHQGHETASDGEAESGSAEAAGGGAVGLSEGFEDDGLLVGGDADAGVLNLEMEEDVVGGFFLTGHLKAHAAHFGKFNGVAEEVDEDLTQTQGIADERVGNVGIQLPGNFEMFLSAAKMHDFQNVVEIGAEMEISLGQFHFSGVDFGKIENVVEQAE